MVADIRIPSGYLVGNKPCRVECGSPPSGEPGML